ncbi:hypothetical protein GCM10011579_032580 [Streptomyces albiflavescens]|uniref:Uncharacterized protein n=1 Tax=Streptomyces albiflavescens TaxID=1623582 RepID=A0A918D4I5_9ACTN|nr:hypothetical protein GCM10011579_032580 [Streptomyces albiflavescens]
MLSPEHLLYGPSWETALAVVRAPGLPWFHWLGTQSLAAAWRGSAWAALAGAVAAPAMGRTPIAAPARG